MLLEQRERVLIEQRERAERDRQIQVFIFSAYCVKISLN